MEQPSKEMITEKLKLALAKKITLDELEDWAMDFIMNDDLIEVYDIDAWHYLLSVSNLGGTVAPSVYLYCDEDIEDMINKYTKQLQNIK